MQKNALFFSVLLAAAAGCTPVSYSQFQSENRAQIGLERKLEAERQAIALVTGVGRTNVVQGTEIQQVIQLEPIRRALADDARADFRVASNAWANATTEDRIVTLSRAGRKAWAAGGAADVDLVKNIQSTANSLCNKDNSAANVGVPRDCELILFFPSLTALQKNRDVILDIGLDVTLRQKLRKDDEAGKDEGLTQAEAAQLIQALVQLNQTSDTLANRRSERGDVKALLIREQVHYYCSFVQGLSLIGANTAPVGARKAAQIAQIPSLDVTDEYSALLKAAKMTKGTFPGVYVRYRDRVAAMAGAQGLGFSTLRQDSDICNNLR